MKGGKRRKINIDICKRHQFFYAGKIIFHHYERQLAISSVIFSFVLQDVKRAIHTHEKSGVDSMCNGQFVRPFARFTCEKTSRLCVQEWVKIFLLQTSEKYSEDINSKVSMKYFSSRHYLQCDIHKFFIHFEQKDISINHDIVIAYYL